MSQSEKTIDRRVKNTKRAIKMAFIEMLAVTSIQKITVSQICLRADINRSTFYVYYRDVYELLDSLKQEILHQIDQLSTELCSHKYDDYTTMRLILDMIYMNRKLLKYLIVLEPDAPFIQSVKEKAMGVFHHNAAQELSLSASEKEEIEPTLIFLANGFYAMYTDWLRRDCATSIDDFAHFGARLTQNCLNALYQEK